VSFADLLRRLIEAFSRPLPGPAAQVLMAPRPRGGWPSGVTPARVRHAAGLLLVYPVGDDPHVMLTVRSDRVRHGGQVSLPGGVVEPGETIEQAALREAHEEVGLVPTDVRVIGALTPIDIPVSGFRLHPLVASTGRQPPVRPSDVEVARVLEVPVSTLLAPATMERLAMTRGTARFEAPAFVTHDVAIWGATAMVLAEFLVLLGWQPPDTRARTED
jgi:8-oxo-dGTP pyrophosphatase MutT (NUDIX family)